MLGYLCDSELKHTENLLTFVFVFVFLWHFFFGIMVDYRKFTHETFSTSTTKLNCHTLMGEKQLNERSTL